MNKIIKKEKILNIFMAIMSVSLLLFVIFFIIFINGNEENDIVNYGVIVLSITTLISVIASILLWLSIENLEIDRTSSQEKLEIARQKIEPYITTECFVTYEGSEVKEMAGTYATNEDSLDFASQYNETEKQKLLEALNEEREYNKKNIEISLYKLTLDNAIEELLKK